MNDYLWRVSYGIGYSFLLDYYYRNHSSNNTKLLSISIISMIRNKCGILIQNFLYILSRIYKGASTILIIRNIIIIILV